MTSSFPLEIWGFLSKLICCPLLKLLRTSSLSEWHHRAHYTASVSLSCWHEYSLLSAHISHQFALLAFKLIEHFCQKESLLMSSADFHWLLITALQEITLTKKSWIIIICHHLLVVPDFKLTHPSPKILKTLIWNKWTSTPLPPDPLKSVAF